MKYRVVGLGESLNKRLRHPDAEGICYWHVGRLEAKRQEPSDVKESVDDFGCNRIIHPGMCVLTRAEGAVNRAPRVDRLLKNRTGGFEN